METLFGLNSYEGAEAVRCHQKRRAPLLGVNVTVGNKGSSVSVFLLAGHYVQDTCVYGLGDLPWIIKSPSLFANKFEPSTDPLVVTCLERWHRLQSLRQADIPVEPHWHF